MAEVAKTHNPLSPIKQALVEVRELRERLDAVERGRREPIAIVGMACRFPCAKNLEEYWSLLKEGRSAITEVPADRWSMQDLFDPDPEAPGRMYTRYGAFVDGIDTFDPHFFGISPREAEGMDPQQRMMLETSWHALEHAGIPPHSLLGTQTGVFVGIGSDEFALLRMKSLSTQEIDPYLATGTSHSVVAGRLSFVLGLEGPSVAVDTACSSSLVALHLACQSLRKRECDLALAGGASLMLVPELTIAFCRARMMAPDGTCKTFDASADGYVRGEGCGVVALRRLSEAIARGERVLAVIRGTAVNQDGRSSGLTVPNGVAQQAVLRHALEDAGLGPLDVGYVEAHGTGTSLGDPIEVHALGAVYCAGRDGDDPLLVGSVKTNIGHLEAAAGVAGLIKVVLALGHGEVPAHLHLKTRNPLIQWDRFALDIPTSNRQWLSRSGIRRAGVSSFGFSGTNAHMVLEEYPQPVLDRSLPERPLHVLALSAKDPAALRDLVVLMQERLAISDKTELPNICFTTNAGRSHHAHRLALHGDTPEALIAGLKAFMKSEEHSTIASGSVQGTSLSPLAFLCTGQGSQYPRMGRILFETSPTFRKTIEQCDAFLRPLLGRGVMDMDDCPSGDERSALIHQTAYTQPALFSLEYALARLWQSWGIEPAYVTGHSAGAYVAACLAGVFSLEDALRLVAIRGRLSQDLPHEGAMAGIDADEASVAGMLAGYEGHVAIAAVNAPDSTVISGERERVEEVLRHCEIGGWKTRRLRVSHAFHSALVEPMLDAFWDALSKVTFHTPAVPMVADTTGLLLGPGEVPGPDYWIEHLRRPVRFKSVMETLDALGVRTYVEVGPDPVLLSLGARSVPADGRFWLPSLRRGWDDWEQLLQSLQELYVRGFSINWNGFEMGYLRGLVSLPGYPFRKGRYWFTSAGSASHRDGTSVPPWEEAISEARRQSGSARVELNIREYPRRWGVLEEWSVGLIVETLRSLGVFAVPNSWITPDGILEQGRILPIHRTLIVRWIDRLVHKGLVLREGEKYSVGEPLPNQDLQYLWGAVEEVLAENQPLLAYLRSCKDKLVAVLRGSLNPLETLFPDGSFDLAEALYERSSTSAYVNDIAAVVVRALTRSYGKESDRHILEIGGGTGGTTASLLPVLPSEGVTYDFTDVSDLFLARALQKFAGWPHLRTAVFDIELESEKQGFQTHFYDLIVGANVVHAVRDLNRTLANLRSLLVPEGVLLLVESTMDHAWFDVSTGLIEGWQRFEDSHRTESPLLSSDRWKEILLENGFVEAHAFPEHRSIGDELGLHVVIARAGGRALPSRISADVAVSSSDASDASGSSGKKGEGGGADQIFLEGLSASLSGERVDLMMTFVRDRVMRILRLDDGHAPGRDARLMDLGMDSLMAIQLRNSLCAGLAIEGTLPATLIFDYPTVREISRYLLSVLSPDARSVQEPRHLTPRGPGDIESLTETEVEDLLMKRLAQQRKSNG